MRTTCLITTREPVTHDHAGRDRYPCAVRTTVARRGPGRTPEPSRSSDRGSDQVPDVAIIFGGPSPEHDVSILTGLQAAHELLRDGVTVRALYWSKVGDWFDVDPALEASAFVDGVPRGATPLRLMTGPRGGFVAEGSRLGRARPYPLDVAIVCCHGGPGEDGTLQGLLDLSGLAYTGPTVASASLGMDKLAFFGLVRAAGLPALDRVALMPETDTPRLRWALYRQTTIRRFLHRYRRGRRSGHRPSLARDESPSRRRGRARALPRGLLRPADRGSHLADPGALGDRTTATDASGGRGGRHTRGILGYADKYQGGEGMASAPRELPAALAEQLREAIRSTASSVARLARVRGVARIDFLCDGAQIYVNEVNTIPGSLARYLWVDPPLSFGSLLSESHRRSEISADEALEQCRGRRVRAPGGRFDRREARLTSPAPSVSRASTARRRRGDRTRFAAPIRGRDE